MEFADLVALWVGRFVIAIATGVFVIGGGMMLADYFGLAMYRKMKAIYTLRELERAAETIREATRTPGNHSS